MNTPTKISVLFLLSVLLWQCEDPIDIGSSFDGPQLVIDAWINDQDTTQEIRLTMSQDYFDGTLPDGVEDAQVSVCRDRGDTCFVFTHQTGGSYIWQPNGEGLGQVGDEFLLLVKHNNKTYSSRTDINRVPPIDSISIVFEEDFAGLDPGLYAQVYAVDPLGVGDSYWIKAWRNDTFLNRPQELNIAFDATFSPGSSTDGIDFIFPIRFGINKIDDGGVAVPLLSGDKMYVEIHSISNEAYRFLTIAQEQMTNGDNGIFSVPLANSPGNIFDEDGKMVLGFFDVAGVSSAEKVVQ